MKKINSNSAKTVTKFLMGLWRISPIMTWTMIISQVVFAVLSNAVAPILVSQLLANIANGTATLANSVWLLTGYIIILFFGIVVSVRITIAMAFLAETKMQIHTSTRVFKHLTDKSLGFHADRMSGGIVSDANKLSGSIERFWDTLIFTAIPIVSTLASVCVVLGFIIWQYALVLAIISILIIVFIVKAQNSISSISEECSKKSSATTAFLADAIGNISTIKAFAKEKSELEKFTSLNQDWRKSSIKEMKAVLVVTGSMGIMMSVLNTCAFVAAIIATEYHIANIGTIYLVITYTLNVVGQLWAVSNMTRNYIRIIGDASPMIETLNDPIELKDIKNPKKLVIKQAKIEFKDVLFTHKDNEEALFDNFSLTINHGERVGLVGRSGSGKTSLTKLLLRFNDIKGGEILIDGQDISKVSQADLHEAIAYVPQEPALFHRSMRDNIVYGRPNATDTEITTAIKQANSTEFINSLPKGLETTVGERGVKLSGGQRQRIAITRAILKDAPILVLDEATSALDSENEKLIQDALWKLMKNRTSIVIAHRLSTIAKLDRIIVLDNGKIVEQGSHAELLEKNGSYARLWAHQSGGFIEE